MEKFLKGENKQSNKCLKQKTSMITKLNINTRIKKKRKWGVLTLHRQDRERQKGGWVKKRRWLFHDLDHWPGICLLRMESSRHSGGCPCQCWRTTCRSRRTWGRGHSSRGGGAGTCPAYCSGVPPHYCSPF